MNNKVREPRDPRPLAKTVLSVLTVYLWWMLLQGLAYPIIAPSAFNAHSGTLDAVIGLLSAVIAFIVMFLVAKWIYRVNLNARVLAPDKSIGPGWAVGWLFVPLAGLFMPFRAMRETWQISQQPQNWRTVGVPPLLRRWWGCWLATYFFESVSAASSSHSAALLERVFHIGFGITMMFATLFLIRIVRAITEAQATAFGETWSGADRAPAPVGGAPIVSG